MSPGYGFTELVQDLILADDDGISPDCDCDDMTDDGLINVEPAPNRNPEGVERLPFLEDGIGLDSMAGLEDEAGVAGRPLAGANAESLALDRRNVPGMGHERDEPARFGRHHCPRPSTGCSRAWPNWLREREP